MKEYTYDEIWEIIRDLVDLKKGNGKTIEIDKILDCLRYCSVLVLQREAVLKSLQDTIITERDYTKGLLKGLTK